MHRYLDGNADAHKCNDEKRRCEKSTNVQLASQNGKRRHALAAAIYTAAATATCV